MKTFLVIVDFLPLEPVFQYIYVEPLYVSWTSDKAKIRIPMALWHFIQWYCV
jgi:hypothetical protein